MNGHPAPFDRSPDRRPLVRDGSVPDGELAEDLRTRYAECLAPVTGLDGCPRWSVGELPVPTMTMADEIAAEVARRQRERLNKAAGGTRADTARRLSAWAHVPLVELFRADGNETRGRGDGLVETGHQPHHGSKSGRCVLIDPKRGYWWCRGCRRSGDAAAYVMAKYGCTYREAAERIAAEYGPPDNGRRPRRRVRWTEF